MIRRVFSRLVPRSWPSRLAIGVAALAVALLVLLLVLVTAECAADCEPFPWTEYLLELALIAAVSFGIIFVVVFAIAVLARAVARRIGWHPRRRREGAVLVLVAVFVLGVGVERAGMLGGPAAASDFELIRESWRLLHEEYVRADDLDSTDLAHAAINAMTEAVGDTGHTVFLAPGEAATDEAELQPAAAGSANVEWAMMPESTVALIRIREFAEGVADQVEVALLEVDDVAATGIVLDLRGNPGGYTEEAIGTVSAFVASGLVNRDRDADGVIYEVPVEGDAVDTTTPLVVLVDGGSASSSEVVASALQVAGRATLVGQTTFGTGTGLEWFPLSDGSELWIGTTEWLTADGRSVWHRGLVPDVIVEMPRGGGPVGPGDLAEMGRKGLRKSGDAQLLKALKLLESTDR